MQICLLVLQRFVHMRLYGNVNVFNLLIVVCSNFYLDLTSGLHVIISEDGQLKC